MKIENELYSNCQTFSQFKLLNLVATALPFKPYTSGHHSVLPSQTRFYSSIVAVRPWCCSSLVQLHWKCQSTMVKPVWQHVMTTSFFEVLQRCSPTHDTWHVLPRQRLPKVYVTTDFTPCVLHFGAYSQTGQTLERPQAQMMGRKKYVLHPCTHRSSGRLS